MDKWLRSFLERRIAGLYDGVRPGAARTIDDEKVAHLIKTTLHTKPQDDSTHWSVRAVSAETGISKNSVQRYFQMFGLQPHRAEGFKLSNDPFFIEKLCVPSCKPRHRHQEFLSFLREIDKAVRKRGLEALLS